MPPSTSKRKRILDETRISELRTLLGYNPHMQSPELEIAFENKQSRKQSLLKEEPETYNRFWDQKKQQVSFRAYNRWLGLLRKAKKDNSFEKKKDLFLKSIILLFSDTRPWWNVRHTIIVKIAEEFC